MTGNSPETTYLSFFVPGVPKPQGSKRSLGRGIMVESCKTLKPWRETVALVAHNAMEGREPLTGPISVYLDFVMPRPKATPKKEQPWATKRPDIDKLARAVLDALTGVVIKDDSQVICLDLSKSIAYPTQHAGVYINLFHVR